MSKDERIAQLEDEIRLLKAQLEQVHGDDFFVGEELKKRRDTLETFDNMPNGTIYRSVRDVRTGMLGFDYVSATWEKITGVSVEESLADARNVFSRVHPDDLPELMQRINESLEPLKNFEVEVRYTHPVTKKEHWVQISSYPRRRGDYIYADGFIFDITDRKLIEIELKAEKIRLEALGNNMPDGTIFHSVRDMQTGIMKFVYVSGTWEKITGVSAEESLADAQNVFKNVHPDYLPELMHKMNDLLVPVEKLEMEVRYLHPQKEKGYEYWAQIASYPRREGDYIYADGFIFDITERKLAEQKLIADGKRMEALGNNLPDGALYQFVNDTKKKQRRFSFVSGTWETIIGIPADVATGSNINAVFAALHPDDLPLLMQAMENSARTMNNLHVEVRAVVRGNVRWMQLSARPRMEGELIVADGIILDITNRKTNEAELVKYRKKLELMVQERTDELNASNKELAVSNRELIVINEELGRYRTQLEEMVREKTHELRAEQNRLQSLVQYLNDGYLHRLRIKASILSQPDAAAEWFKHLELVYASANWEKLTNIPLEDAMQDFSQVSNKIYPEDSEALLPYLFDSICKLTPFEIELRYVYSENNIRWRWMSLWFYVEGEWIICEGLILDITERKQM